MATTTETSSSTLPAYLQPYAQDVAAQAYDLFQSQVYQPYGGQRLAGFSPLEQQAFGAIQQFRPAEQIGQATTLANQAGLGALGAGQNYLSSFSDPSQIAGLMSPYMQGVVEQQKQQAIRDYAKDLPQLGAATARVGGLGGNRQAIIEAEGQRGLYDRLGNIQATGLQNAYEQALKNLQFGSTLGVQGYGSALQGAQTLGNLGQTAYGQATGIAGLQGQAGSQQRGLEQQALDAQYQDFLARQAYPQQSLGFYSNIIRGLPAPTSTTTSTTQPSGSNWGTYLGALATGLGAYGGYKNWWEK